MSGILRGTTTIEQLVVSGTVSLPDGGVSNDEINAGASIDSSKLKQRPDMSYAQADGSDVVSETILTRVCRAAGTLVAIEARVTTAPTGGDKQFTVDIQKASDGSGSWSTLLTGVITFASGDSGNTKKAGTAIGTPTTAAGDALRIVVTASGSTGSQGQGLVVTPIYEEAPV